MCDVSAAQGCLCAVSIKVRNATVTLFTHSCVFIGVVLGLQVLDLSVEVFVNEWFCQCVHTFPLDLMQTISPIVTVYRFKPHNQRRSSVPTGRHYSVMTHNAQLLFSTFSSFAQPHHFITQISQHC